MSKKDANNAEAAPPSAGVMQQLDALTAQKASEERNKEAWRLIVSAQTNADFHAVLDFATDAGLCLPCVNTDPKHTPNLTWFNPIDGTEMVWIPPGEFLYGPEKKSMQLEGFSLAKYTITNSQFAGFLKATHFEPDPTEDEEPEYVDEDYINGEFLQHWSKGKIPKRKQHHPVVFVSYIEALAYCRWAGLTLPGEYQWEKAARGPDGRTYPWGNNIPYHCTYEKKDNRIMQLGQSDTCPVTKLEQIRSPYGCVQLMGNVSQWCQPANEKKPETCPPVYPTVQEGDLAAVRGVPYIRSFSMKTKPAAHRRCLSAHRRNKWTGFRPACFLPVRPALV